MAADERAEDLTGKARIRDAALEQFAELGEKGATVRGIAKAAGVSPALVQHHYGTKEALRRACDEHVMEVIRETKRDMLDGGVGDPGLVAIAVRTSMHVQRYLARALTDGSEAARSLFDEAVRFSEDMLQHGSPGLNRPTTEDPRGYATVLTAFSFGLLALHEHVSRALGVDTLTQEGYARMALASLDVYGDTLLDPEFAERARTALKSLAPKNPPAAGGPPPDKEDR